MGRVRVEVDFELESAFLINQECLTQSIRFSRDGCDVEVRLPAPEKGSGPIAARDLGSIDGYAGSTSHVDTPTEFLASFSKLVVCIRDEVDGISQAEFEGDVPEDAKNLISGHQKKCRKLAERVVADFLDQLRHLGQTWLGSTGTIPYSVAPYSVTFDDETGYRFKFGHGGTYTVQVQRDEASLTKETLAPIRDALEASQGIPLASAFLADAEYFLGCGMRNETQSDLQRAVLLAAIACELKVKETLREKAFQGASALVDVLINSPRDFSMSVASLCDKAMKVAVGHSLKEDNRELYKALVETNRKDSLFQNRNAIVHSGRIVIPDVVRQNVHAAREVYDWLDKLPALQSPPTN
jgi:hypothetical protein